MKLILPNKKYFKSYTEAITEYKQNKVSTYEFLDMSENDVFEYIENSRLGQNLPDNYVKATYLWLVQDDEFIGELSVRHSLTEALMQFGGNIGYGIKFSRWNQGLGTIMLSKALRYSKDVIGLEKVLITCNDHNLGSIGVIEKNGGVLQDKVVNVFDGAKRLTRRYWIEIQ